MRKTFYQKHRSAIEKFDGILLKNPVLERGLVIAPIVVASYNYQNSLLLGVSFVIITFFSVLLSSFLPKFLPYTVRILLYTLLSCVVFIPTAMLMEMLFPATVFKVGVFLPLLVTNSLVVIKAQSRFHKERKGAMVLDLFCNTLGFFLVIVFVGIFRELVGSGTLFGNPVKGIPTIPAVLLPFSGFILVGLLAAAVKRFQFRLDNPHLKRGKTSDPTLK